VDVDSPLIVIGLPLALAVIMLGLGLSLKVEDFTRVTRYPKTVLAALACQTVVMPAVCLGLVLAFAVPPELAVGMMLLAATPGGTMANVYSHLFGGEVALNLTLTAINSVLAIVTLPIAANLSATYFLDDGANIGFQVGKVLQVVAFVLVPVAIGMLVRGRVPRVADRLDRPVKILSGAMLAVIIVGAVLGDWRNLPVHFAEVGLVVVTFSVLNLSIGYGVGRWVGRNRRTAIAVGFETGVHNGALAIAIALSPAFFDSARMAVAPGLYGLVNIFTATAFGFIVSRRRAAPAAADPSERRSDSDDLDRIG
jgi:BASS family bile acid:Na+ symporter